MNKLRFMFKIEQNILRAISPTFINNSSKPLKLKLFLLYFKISLIFHPLVFSFL